MGQLYWPETVGLARYSIPSHGDHYRALSSASKILFRQTFQNSNDDHTEKPIFKLVEINQDNKSSSNDIENLYDGLTLLDETRLDEMIETDLISSSNV
jgi:hypothetical protein